MTYTEARPNRWTLSEVRRTGSGWPCAGDIPTVHRTYWELLDDVEQRRRGRASRAGQAFARLDRLANLGPAWDGMAARAIAPSVIDAVGDFATSDLIDHTEIKPEVVPTLDGGIQLEWHTSGVDLIIECEPSGSTSYYYRDVEAGEESEGSLLEAQRSLAAAFVKLGYRA